MAIEYGDVLQAAIVQLSQLLKERENTEREIRRQENLIRALGARFCEKISEASRAAAAGECVPPELSSTIRNLLSTYPVWFTPPMIRDMLPVVGIDTGRYRDTLISIHAVLRRLVLNGEIIRSEQPKLGVVYRWPDLTGQCPVNMADTKSQPKQLVST